ncbi:MAG: HAMP domain-containing histidine kinase [Alphaproteobacteria bacterium]|nr:HAMP domain-containing histidine kinase [Alphaproteobacteria bacterium]
MRLPAAPSSLPPPFATARIDANNRLVAADEPLLGLHLRCGGEVPGAIAVPALLEAVRKARALGLRLARPILAHDSSESVTAWVEIQPLGAESEGGEGCRIELRHWQAKPLPHDDEGALARRRIAIERQVAEFHARLDAGQNVLLADAQADDLMPLAAAMQADPGRPWTDFVTIEGSAHRQPLHWRLLDGATVRVAGSDRPWRAALVPQALAGGEPTGFEFHLSSDVPFSPKALARPVEPGPKGRMIGREVAPVLRQPIARIIANAETIRARLAGPLADEYSGYAADIASAGQHLLALIDDLSDLEVVEAEGFSTAPDRIDLAEVARQAAGILGGKAREAEIVIDAPKLGERLAAVAEFRRVLQVLLNLVGNALRYAPARSQIWIRLEEDGHFARVIVADQGPGLDPAQQTRVFEKFERLGRSGDGGSGLGLYISRRLARAMGGDLTVESAPGQGARFILSVPANVSAPTS